MKPIKNTIKLYPLINSEIQFKVIYGGATTFSNHGCLEQMAGTALACQMGLWSGIDHQFND